MSSNNEIIISPEPLKPRIERLQTLPGNNLAGALRCAIAQNKLSYTDLPRVEIKVNGKLQPKEKWALDRCLVEGDIVVIDVKTNGDNPLRTAFQVFIQVGAIVVGHMFGPWAAAAVQVGGALLTSLLFPPNRPEQLADANDSGALRDQSNNIRRRYPMPLVLGRQRVGFDVAALGYSENIGDTAWINVIFGVHYGPCQIEDVKIGETSLADYPASDYQVEYFLTPGPRNSQLYKQSKFQENRNDELDLNGTWEVTTLQANADQGEVDITLPNGLNFTDDKGRKKNEEVAGEIQVAEVGTENWAPAALPPTVDKNGQAMPAGSFYINAKTANAIRRTYVFNLPDNTKQYKIRVKAYDRDARFDETSVWDTYWTATRSVFFRQPIADENLSCVVLRVKSSGDLNGTLPVVSGIVTPIVPIYADGNWETQAPSSNMAACLRWVLTGTPAANPMSDDEINESCAVAYGLIEANNWQAAIYATDEMSQEDIMRVCGQAGRFSTYWSGEDLCFVTDWEKPVPRQLFTAANVSGYKYRREYQDEIHAVFVEFKNLDEDSTADELWVYADGYNEANATQFETMRLGFACTKNRAYREGRVYLAKRELKTETHEFTAAFDTVTATYGDRIKVAHHAALYGKAAGRVVNRWFNADRTQVTGIRVDFKADMEAGLDYSIDVRRPTEPIIGIQLVNNATKSRNLYFAQALALGDAPKKDDLVIFGETNLVTEDVEIDSFEAQDSTNVRIAASRYVADLVEAAETGPIPDLPNGLRPREPAPIPRIIDTRGQPDGVEVIFDVIETPTNPVSGFVARWRYSGGSWNTLPPLGSTTRSFKTPALDRPSYDQTDFVPGQQLDPDAETKVDVEILTVMRRKDYSLPARVSNIPIVKKVQAPGLLVSAQGMVRQAPDGSSYPVINVQCPAITTGDVSQLDIEIAPFTFPPLEEGEEPQTPPFTEYVIEEYVPLGSLMATDPRGDFRNVVPGTYYMLRCRWRTHDNWVSEWKVVTTFVDPLYVPAGSTVASDTTHVGGLPALVIAEAVESFETSIAAVNEQLAAADTALSEAIQNFDYQLGLVYQAVDDANADFDGRLDALDTGLNGLQQGQQNLQTQIDGRATTAQLNFQINRIDNQQVTIGQLTTTVNDLPNQYATVTQYNTLASEIANARGGTGSLSARFTQQTQALTDGLAGKASVSQFTQLNSTVTTQGGQIGGLLTRMSQAEADIDGNVTLTDFNSLAGRVTTAEGSISGAIGRLDSVEIGLGQRVTVSTFNNWTAEIADAHAGYPNLRATIDALYQTSVDGDLVQAQRSAALEAQMAGTTNSGLRARLITVETATTDGRFATATSLSNLNARVGEAEGDISSLQQVTTDGTLVSNVVYQGLRAEVEDARRGRPNLGAVIDSTYQTTIDGDSALALRANALEARVGMDNTSGLSARLVTVETATTNGSLATATQVSNLSARLNAGGDIYGSIQQVNSVAVTAQGTANAISGVTQDVNGLISGYASVNNGQVAGFHINADWFAITKPGGGARTEYSNGHWRVYDSTGALRVEMGVF